MGFFWALVTLTISRILYGAFSEYCKHHNQLMAQVLWKVTKWTFFIGAFLGGYAVISYWVVEAIQYYAPEKIAMDLIIMYFALCLVAVCSVLEEV